MQLVDESHINCGKENWTKIKIKQMYQKIGLVLCQKDQRWKIYTYLGEWWRSLEKRKETCILFIDLEKVYDKIHKKVILNDLENKMFINGK